MSEYKGKLLSDNSEHGKEMQTIKDAINESIIKLAPTQELGKQTLISLMADTFVGMGESQEDAIRQVREAIKCRYYWQSIVDTDII